MAIKSRQPRFSSKTDDVFSSWYNWASAIEEEEPPYNSDSRARDQWLRKFIMKEPHIMGVVSTVTSIDKNRGWHMIGGKTQVSRYTRIFHNIEVAPGLKGWRPGIAYLSNSFWTSDMGAIIEVGRSGKDGPLRGLYCMDPARCKLTGKAKTPLTYYPKRGQSIPLEENDFLRIASLPYTDDSYNGLGYSAVSRCLELTKIMIYVMNHHKETLGAKAPKGLLLLNGISQRQWNDAMQAREIDLQGKDREYFAQVAVLASANATVDAKLLALSSLPISFQLREWIDMLMFGYALCFNYDPSEFYPVQYGALGRGVEQELQHEKATGKGRLDFVLGLQEQIKEDLPDSLEFLFDQRDEKGDLLHAEVDQAWSRVADTLLAKGAVSVPEARYLLARQGVIPQSWAPTSDVESTDLVDPDNEPEISDEDPKLEEPSPDAKTNKQAREILLEMPRVIRAIERFPDEPLIEYCYPERRAIILAHRASELLERKIWTQASPSQKKFSSSVKRTTLSKLGRFLADAFSWL